MVGMPQYNNTGRPTSAKPLCCAPAQELSLHRCTASPASHLTSIEEVLSTHMSWV